jgi:hypothetical protein
MHACVSTTDYGAAYDDLRQQRRDRALVRLAQFLQRERELALDLYH